MNSTRIVALSLLTFSVCVMGTQTGADAALNSQQRKDLSKIRRDVSRVAALVKRKKTEEAEKALTEAEAQVKKIATDAEVKETDPAIRGILTLISRQRAILAKQAGTGKKAGGGVSYIKDVAPIISQKCGNCHGNRASGGLKLTTFAGMKAGGRNKPLLVRGKATSSLLYRRLTAPQANQRMPRNAAALSAAELRTITSWINQGARFDGKDENAVGGGGAANGKPDPAVIIAKPTGNETVSFTEDIAPFMVNLCVRCHSGNDPNGGLSLVSFESMMKGGDSGRVLLPGNLEGSRLFRLTGGLENPRMPQGQARITRKNYEDLRTWVSEGIKFDGSDPKTPLRQLVPTEDQRRADELAKLTPEEFAKLRLEKSEATWKRVLPKDRPAWVESKEFFVFGNASQDRLKELNGWAEDHSKSLRKLFGVKDDLLWKGKLTIFVVKDRFAYKEFNLTISSRETPPEMVGHSEVTAGFEEAYVVVQDVGDEAGESSPGMKVNLIDNMTGAFLKRGGRRLPDWIIRGTGMAIAAKADPGNEYVRSLGMQARKALSSLEKPEDVFADGKFPPSETAAVGYTLVDFMLRSPGGGRNFGRFVSALQRGSNLQAALRSVYQSDSRKIGLAYFNAMKSKKK